MKIIIIAERTRKLYNTKNRFFRHVIGQFRNQKSFENKIVTSYYQFNKVQLLLYLIVLLLRAVSYNTD